jgi:sucrose-6-phosphate hydrolase SacC (GH32 family)
VGYNVAKHILYIDRSHSSQQVPSFSASQVLVLSPHDGVVELRIVVDRISLEVFADGGRALFSNQTFSGPDSQRVELFAEGGAVRLVSLEAYRQAQ